MKKPWGHFFAPGQWFGHPWSIASYCYVLIMVGFRVQISVRACKNAFKLEMANKAYTVLG